MRAARYHGYGAPEVLVVEDAPRPEVGPRDVLVAVHATSVNPVDCKIRRGIMHAVLPGGLPRIPGMDVSGLVEAVGTDVTRFVVGDAVYGSPTHKRPGTTAEYVAVDEAELAKKPEGLTHAEAASLPLVFLTAWECLVRKAGLGPGQTVLIHAGAGGVGTAAIQLARHLQARVVTTCSPRNTELVTSLGADQVVDYRTTDAADVLSGVDVVLDCLDWTSHLKSMRMLRRGGHLTSIASGLPGMVGSYGPWLGVLATGARMAILTVRGWLWGRRVHHVIRSADGRVLEALTELVAIGSIRPVVDRVFPLDQIADAHAYSETGRARGKIVIQVR